MAMYFERVGRVAVGFHDEKPPTDEEWNRWIGLCTQAHQLGGYAVIRSLGGFPNAKQRVGLGAALGHAKMRSAVLLDSQFIRGIATALSWLGIPVRPFRPTDLKGVQAYIGLSDAEIAEVQAQLDRLEQRHRTESTGLG